MKTIYIFKGLPASGKSTEAKRRIAENPNQYKRINKDDLRAMLDDSQWSRDAEEFILTVRDMLIIEALRAGKHVIVDDTNLVPKHEARIKQIAHEYTKITGDQVSVKMEFFDCPVDECIKRDLKRAASVGESVIRKMYREHLAPKPRTPAWDPSRGTVILCDLDGTLALLNGRDPYDASTCEQDSMNWPVHCILQSVPHPVVFVSGRKDTYKAETERWLACHGYAAPKLFMRKADDNRKDCVIKEEIYKEHIEGKFNVAFVLDDRNQVVELWRRLGLTCLQVADGDF